MEKPTFESIVLEHGPFIRRTLAQLGVASADLKDVEQEVLRGIHRGLSVFDPELSESPSNALRGWLFAICERQAANHRRARLRRGELLLGNDELDTSPGSGPSSEERLVAEQHRVILLRLVDKLEPQRRAVLVTYELEGLPMADVAAAFAIPVNTAWNRLRLAREDLREAWKRYEKKRRSVR
jgi:RNA polymerase sigma-70 factor (ECF subfamily)